MTGNKVYVIVTSQAPGRGGAGVSKSGVGKGGKAKLTDEQKKAKEKAQTIRKAQKRLASYVMGQVVNITESAISFNANNLGYMTGDYIAQRDAQIASKLVNTSLGMAESFIGSAVIGGSAGMGFVGLGLALVSSSVSKTVNYFQNEALIQKAISKSDRQAEYYAARSGLSSNTNNSRGTDN